MWGACSASNAMIRLSWLSIQRSWRSRALPHSSVASRWVSYLPSSASTRWERLSTELDSHVKRCRSVIGVRVGMMVPGRPRRAVVLSP